MKEKVRRNQKKLFAMNARNRVISKVSVLNSYKNKEAKEKRKAFKVTWDDTSKSEKEEE